MPVVDTADQGQLPHPLAQLTQQHHAPSGLRHVQDPSSGPGDEAERFAGGALSAPDGS